MSARDVADTVTAAIGGMNIGKFKSEGERYDIAVRFLESGRNGMERLADLAVPSAKGGPKELRQFADALKSEVPVEINRYNRQREITVFANLAPGKVLGDAVPEVEGMMKAVGVPEGYSTAWTGLTITHGPLAYKPNSLSTTPNKLYLVSRSCLAWRMTGRRFSHSFAFTAALIISADRAGSSRWICI